MRRYRTSSEHWRTRSWHPTEELGAVLSSIIQEHAETLSRRNDDARKRGVSLPAVTETKLIQLQDLWQRLYPMRELELSGFSPRVTRHFEDGSASGKYSPRDMSDGERTILYMAARVLAAEESVIVVDEPELHMHSRLAISFWDEAERLRPDCRFVYVTHDLGFALSRRRATYFLSKSPDKVEPLGVADVPAVVATEVLGAATLPFYARRVCMYEGEPGQGFATEFLSAWFDGPETVSIPCGDRDSVFAAVSGLSKVGVTGAEVVGLVDRDYYPDAALANVTSGVIVLQVHEIESVLCSQTVVSVLAEHFGKDAAATWKIFHGLVTAQFSGGLLSKTVAERVRAQVNDLCKVCSTVPKYRTAWRPLRASMLRPCRQSISSPRWKRCFETKARGL